MAHIAYVNGAYLPIERAGLSIEDRAVQFADSVYEGITVFRGQMIDADAHIRRLHRSATEIGLAMPMSDRALAVVLGEVIRRNPAKMAFLYIQISRGVAPRNHIFPSPRRPGLIVTCRRLDAGQTLVKAREGVAIFSQPDERWGRCDIKATVLLPNLLAREASAMRGGFEAALVERDGMVTEGAATNLWMMKDGTLKTRPTSANILAGVTRSRVMEIAKAAGWTVKEEAFSLDALYDADEVFLTGSTFGVMPVSWIDDRMIGVGQPGPVARQLVMAYWAFMESGGVTASGGAPSPS